MTNILKNMSELLKYKKNSHLDNSCKNLTSIVENIVNKQINHNGPIRYDGYGILGHAHPLLFNMECDELDNLITRVNTSNNPDGDIRINRLSRYSANYLYTNIDVDRNVVTYTLAFKGDY